MLKRLVSLLNLNAFWLALVALALGFFSWGLWPLLHKLGSRALCYADGAGLREALAAPLPGGLFDWCVNLLASTWEVPWLGLTLFILLGLAVSLLAWRWVRLPLWAIPLPWATSLFLANYCGFAAWIHPHPVFPIAQLLIAALVLFLMGLARRWDWSALVGVLLYPFCGSAACLGLLASAALPKVRWWVRGLLVLGALVWPIAWQLSSEADPAWGALLGHALSTMSWENGTGWNILLIVAFLLLVAAPWVKVWPRSLLASLCVLYVIGLFGFRDPSATLYHTLACERALERNDIATLASLPPALVVEHRMLSAYTIYGLWRKGQLEERMFDYDWKVSHEGTTINTMMLDGYRLLYRYGLVQMARRWCYESVISLGWTADKYRLMARCALITGEPLLAERYALQLRRLPFHRGEADELLALAKTLGQVLPEDTELLRVADLHNRLCADPGSPVFENDKRLEVGIYNRYAVLKNGNRDMVALYLCSSLLRKDTTPLVENFDVILQQWPQRPLPKAFQQGLLSACSSLPPVKQPHLTQDLFSPTILRDFETFRALSKGATTHEILLPFRRTYWFYAACVP